MKAVATTLNTEWNATPFVAHIPEYYGYDSVYGVLRSKGVIKQGTPGDNLHDDPAVEFDHGRPPLDAVRWEACVRAGKATIDGVSIADQDLIFVLAKGVAEFRAAMTIVAMKKTITDKGKTSL